MAVTANDGIAWLRARESQHLPQLCFTSVGTGCFVYVVPYSL
jgi:hypothetical protein